MPDRPVPGRALVTRRAVEEIVRAAALGATASRASPTRTCGAAWAPAPAGRPGVRVELHDGIRAELLPHGRLRRPRRRGGATGRVGGPLRAPPRARRRARPPRRPHRRPAATSRHGRRGDAAVPRRGRSAEAGRDGRGVGVRGRTRPRPSRREVPRMTRRSCDGAGLLAAFRAAVAAVEAHVDELNALNVYPVPDGDTGSNMLATVRAALEEGERDATDQADRVAAAISFGALMGARGNSGVILSQVFRGIADGLRGKHRFNGLDVAHALTVGSRDGLCGRREAGRGDDPHGRPGSLGGGRRGRRARERHRGRSSRRPSRPPTVALARTPIAPARPARRRRRGRGRPGFFRVCRAPWRTGYPRATRRRPRHPRAIGHRPIDVVPHADEGFGYETMFLARGGRRPVAGPRRDPDAPGVDRRVRPRRRRPAGGEGPRPQRAAGPGRRLRPGPRDVEPDQHREPRPPGPRREGGAVAVAATRPVRGLARGAAPDPGPVARTSLADVGHAPSPRRRRTRVGATDDRLRTSRVQAGAPASVPLAVVAVAAATGSRRSSSRSASRCRAGRTVGQPEHRRAAQGGRRRSMPTRSCVLPNNPNVVMAARQVAQLARPRSTSCRRGTPPKASRRCSPSIRARAAPPTSRR